MSKQDKDYLDKLRHSAAHLLAAAVMDLYPDAKRTIGPAIENGFYFDFDFGEVKISENDLPKIEKRMRKLAPHFKAFEKHELNSSEAKEEYPDNEYKHELIDEIIGNGNPPSRNASEGQEKKVSFYESVGLKSKSSKNNENYWDLCKGGHVDEPSKELKHFKLLKVAGAYWRGDENNTMLTRIYGTIFPKKEELDTYLQQLEEARKRDHKKLGKEFDLFTFSELVGGGLPLWTPKGALLRNLLDNYVWDLREEHGYEKVEIPHITKKDLFETSGHWDKFADELFRIKTREGHEFAMKPMNCPFHTQIYDRRQHSYRELPQRYANTTMVYRDEQSGELSGLSRVRSITQDDAHVFCRESQVEEEALKIWDIVHNFYKACGFPKLTVRLSLHDPDDFDKYLGTKEAWEKAENHLRKIIDKKKVEYFEAKGEAAFYGPKIDFMGYDSLGREWQVATIQIDRNMPERFDLTCVDEDNNKERVVMLHAAIMGSIERFMSVLIEHFAGAFPVWISPVQVKVLPITDRNIEYVNGIADELREQGVRIEVDSSSETLGNKIRKAQEEKVPYMLIAGDKEESAKKIAVRLRTGEDLGQMDASKFSKRILENIESKSLEL